MMGRALAWLLSWALILGPMPVSAQLALTGAGKGVVASASPAPTIVQSGTVVVSADPNPQVVTLTSPATNGNTIVWWTTTGVGLNITNITDSSGGTYTLDYEDAPSQRTRFYRRSNVAGAPTSFQFDTSSVPPFIRIFWVEVQGLTNSSPLGQTVSTTFTTTTSPSISVTTTTTDEIILTAMHVSSGATTFSATAPSSVGSMGTGSSTLHSLYRTTTGAPGSYATAGTLGASSSGTLWSVSYKKP